MDISNRASNFDMESRTVIIVKLARVSSEFQTEQESLCFSPNYIFKQLN